MAFTISVDNNNLTSVAGEELIEKVVVTCDGKEDNYSFLMDIYGDDDITVIQNRCKLDIYVKPNKTNEDKQYTIRLTHVNDNEVFVDVNIFSIHKPYKIDILHYDKSNLTIGDETGDDKCYFHPVDKHNVFQVFLQSDLSDSKNKKEGKSAYYEEKVIPIRVQGGSEKYRIRSVYRYESKKYFLEGKKLDEIDEIRELHPFNDEFIIIKNPDNITIRNYGLSYLWDGFYNTTIENFVECVESYFIITVCHEDDKYILPEVSGVEIEETRILVTYGDVVSGDFKEQIPDEDVEPEAGGDDPDIGGGKDPEGPGGGDDENICDDITLSIEVIGEENGKITYDCENTNASVNPTAEKFVMLNVSASRKIVVDDKEETEFYAVSVRSSTTWCNVSLDKQTDGSYKLKISVTEDIYTNEVRKATVTIKVTDCPNIFCKINVVQNPVGVKEPDWTEPEISRCYQYDVIWKDDGHHDEQSGQMFDVEFVDDNYPEDGGKTKTYVVEFVDENYNDSVEENYKIVFIDKNWKD